MAHHFKIFDGTSGNLEPEVGEITGFSFASFEPLHSCWHLLEVKLVAFRGIHFKVIMLGCDPSQDAKQWQMKGLGWDPLLKYDILGGDWNPD